MPHQHKIETEASVTALIDEKLILRVSRGDALAFETLIDRYQGFALRMARRFTGRRHEAEDLVQDAFLQVLIHVDRYNPETAPFKTWFFAILINLCRNAVKKSRNLTFIELPTNASAVDDPASAITNQEQRAALAIAVAKLPPYQRLAVTLRYEEDMSYAEAAAALGVSVSAVRSLLARAKHTLRRELEEFEKKSSD